MRLSRQQRWWRQRHRNPFGQAHTIGVFCCRKTAHRRVTAVTGGQGRRLWTKVTTWSGEMASRLHHPRQADETLTPKSYVLRIKFPYTRTVNFFVIISFITLEICCLQERLKLFHGSINKPGQEALCVLLNRYRKSWSTRHSDLAAAVYEQEVLYFCIRSRFQS